MKIIAGTQFLRENSMKIICSTWFLCKNSMKIIVGTQFLRKNRVKLIIATYFLRKNSMKLIIYIPFLRKNRLKLIIPNKKPLHFPLQLNTTWYTNSGTDQPIQKREGEMSSNVPNPIFNKYFKASPEMINASVTI